MVYERDLEKLKVAYEKSPQYGEDGCVRDRISSEINSRRHAKSLCVANIGREVVQRWKEGTNLNVEKEETH